MLTSYFEGPIGADVVAKLHAEVARVLADPPLHAGMMSAFLPSNNGRAYAWREDLSFQRTSPRSIDLAAWIAWSRPGYPRVRPYCPDGYVGTWIQREPAADPAPRWTFGRDGAFSAPGSPYANRISWRVHRQGTKGNALWLDDDFGVAAKRLVVVRLTATELHLQPTSPAMFRLERA